MLCTGNAVLEITATMGGLAGHQRALTCAISSLMSPPLRAIYHRLRTLLRCILFGLGSLFALVDIVMNGLHVVRILDLRYAGSAYCHGGSLGCSYARLVPRF